MKSRVLNFINWGVLVVVTLVVIWMAWGLWWPGDVSGDDSLIFSEECVDVDVLEKFRYDGCYDASSEMIFLKISRMNGDYLINKLIISFVDVASQSYDLNDVPEAGEEKAYKLLAKKNPGKINIELDVVKNFSGSVCEGTTVLVDHCPAGTGGEGAGVSISPIDGVGIKDFVEIKNFPEVDSDVVVIDLIEKEKIWESVCKSNWDCGKWEICIDGVEKRTCKDLNNCAISTDSPLRAKRCDGACIEDWECEWSECRDGVSVPKCRDLGDCGTSYDEPKELACEYSGKCVPNVVCDGWSECEVDYNFFDLIGPDRVIELSGSKTRLCVDKKDCVSTSKEIRECSIGVDIYTKRFERCGENYIGVHNALDDNILAVLKEGRGEDNYLNIYFDDKSGVYCDYCFDGEKNGDEEGVDCGGSCKDCEKRASEKMDWWEGLFKSFGF